MSITIQTLLPRKMQVGTALKPLFTAMPLVALVTLSACARSPDITDSVPPSLPAGTVPAELPRAPVPDVIPGLQEGAENDAIGIVTPSEGQQPLQSGRILGGIEINLSLIHI